MAYLLLFVFAHGGQSGLKGVDSMVVIFGTEVKAEEPFLLAHGLTKVGAQKPSRHPLLFTQAYAVLAVMFRGIEGLIGQADKLFLFPGVLRKRGDT